MPGHRVEGAAQARLDHQVRPAQGTIPFVSGRSNARRAVPVTTHLTWPI
jgi:hypothetical protein